MEYEVIERFSCDYCNYVVDVLNRYITDKRIKAVLLIDFDDYCVLRYFCEVRKYKEVLIK